jgi:hypothetical protein
MTKDLRLAFIKPSAAVLASPRIFKPHGQSGIEFSDFIPNIASCADDICLVRGMVTDAFNHHPGQLLLFTGSQQFGRPTLGAWVLYGLGSESQNLPGFVVLSSGVGTSGGASNFAPGFLPSAYGGVTFRSGPEPILYLSNPEGVTAQQQRAELDVLRDLNQERLKKTGDVEIAVAHRVLRTRLPHAIRRARPHRFFEGIRGDARDVRRQQGTHAPVRYQLPAGTADGRARRPLRHADARQLGSAHISESRAEKESARSPTSPPRR